MKIKTTLFAVVSLCFSVNALALTYPADCKNKTLERTAQKMAVLLKRVKDIN